jgi:hypothetical protein
MGPKGPITPLNTTALQEKTIKGGRTAEAFEVRPCLIGYQMLDRISNHPQEEQSRKLERKRSIFTHNSQQFFRRAPQNIPILYTDLRQATFFFVAFKV